MNAQDYEKYYPAVTDACMTFFTNTTEEDPLSLLLQLMDIEGMPIHCPVHHYMIPAALLTVCRRKQGCSFEVLERDLAEALARARNVLSGFCGYYGTCGAAVGLGIFWSIITESTPYSRKNWSHMNRATGQALLRMAESGGPRCCKRNSFIALQSSLDQINELLSLDIRIKEPIVCRYNENNKECLKKDCPYWPEY